MSRKSKKSLATIILIALAVLGLLAWGGLKYIESKIVAELRQTIASAPPELELQVGPINFSLINSHLEAQNISFINTQDGLRSTHHLEQLELYDLTLDLNETTPTTLAETIIIHNYSLKGTTPANLQTTDTQTLSTKYLKISKPSFDLPNFKQNLLLTAEALLKDARSTDPSQLNNAPESPGKSTPPQDSKEITQNSPPPNLSDAPLALSLANLPAGLPLELIQKLPADFVLLALSYALGAEETKLNNLQMQYESLEEQVHISIDQITKFGLDHENIASCQVQGIALSLDTLPILSIASLNFHDYTAPSYAKLLQLAQLAPAKTMQQATQTINLLEEIFMGSEPLLRQIELNNLQSLLPEMEFGLYNLKLSIPQAKTFSYDLQHLSLPPKEFFWLDQVMVGLKTLDISSTGNLAWSEGLKTHGTVLLAGMAQLNWQGEIYLDTPMVANSLLGIRALELKQLTLSLEDLGLLGRLAAAAQANWSISPENSVFLAQAAITDELKQLIGSELTEQYLPEITKTLENPGKFELKLNFEQGMPIHMLDKMDLSSFIQFKAIPGTKKLSETMPKLD